MSKFNEAPYENEAKFPRSNFPYQFLIDKKLKKYQNKESEKKFSILALSSYEKISQSKNLSGKTTNYLVTIDVSFEIKKDNEVKRYLNKEQFLIKNFNNKFEENNLEKIKKENLIDSIISRLVVQLSQIE